ncbi:MAG: hypothetical protein GY804_14945 [Alphaproteobacteria bacterium]|nr:hypothetical protein [Alphaproteobacteria bacterium]
MTKSSKDLIVREIIEHVEFKTVEIAGDDGFDNIITEVAKELYEKWGNDQKRGKGY